MALSILSRFRDIVCTIDDQVDLRYCVDTLGANLHRVSSALQPAETERSLLKVQCLGLSCKIFYAIGSAQQQPDATSAIGIDIHMSNINAIVLGLERIPWFLSILQDPNLDLPGEDFDEVHAGAIDNLRLYMEDD